jgi:hypothetical protein
MEVVSLNRKQIFNLNEAQNLLPIIYRITDVAQKEVKLLANRVEAIKKTNIVRASEIETEINFIIEKWQDKVEKLGAKPKGLWLADFDKGDGYYCWKFPETQIAFWHGYNDGFSGRLSVNPETHA